MLRLSKRTDYALLALKYLAVEAPEGIASARAIAERYDIPLELLAKILQHLARHGFVAAHKGVHGGYHLARSPDAMSIADVVQIVDGPLAVTACSPADRIKERILSVLQTVTVADMSDAETGGRLQITVSGGERDAGIPLRAR